MTPKEYTAYVIGLASTSSTKDQASVLFTAALGLSGEAGEFADTVKKVMFHEKELDKKTIDSLQSELSDVLWYVTFAAGAFLGLSLQDIIDYNVAKLSARYPTGKFNKDDFDRKELNRTDNN